MSTIRWRCSPITRNMTLRSRGEGVVVDLPEHSAVAAVEIGMNEDVRVVLLHLDELRQVAPARPRRDD